MSDDNIISFKGGNKSEQSDEDACRIEMRDEMLEMLDAIRSRVEAFGIQGFIMIAWDNNPENDTLYTTTFAEKESLLTVGSLEYFKNQFINKDR